jgi:hypothetical protein
VAVYLSRRVGEFQRQDRTIEEENDVRISKVLIVMVALPVVLQVLTAVGIAGTPVPHNVIGRVVSGDAFRLNGDTVISNGTLLDGAVVETARTASSVQLSNGTRLSLSPASRARVYGDRMILEKGETRIENVVGFHLEALGLVVRPGVRPGSASSSGWIALEGTTRLRVSALTGTFRVWNARGVLVANVAPGSALAFEPQPAAAATTQITGTLTEQRGHFMLTDRVTRVTVEITGQRLAGYVGQVIGVTGAMNVAATSLANAPQVIAASDVQSIDNSASVAVVGGVSAVESRAKPEDVPQGPPPDRPKGPPPGRPKGPPETPPGLSR